jgi:bZIP-type transcription factor MBZ1
MSNFQPAGCLDPLDPLSEYETVSYHSLAISPSTSKVRFPSRSVSNTTSSLPSSTLALTGPSHNYDLYRPQTGSPQGAVAKTLAVNCYNMHTNQNTYGDPDASDPGSNDDFVDIGTTPGPTGSFNGTDMDFDSPKTEAAFFYLESSARYIDPRATSASLPTTNSLPTQSSNVCTVWPDMHQQQAAVAKAQALQKQQQQIVQQQRQRAAAGRPGQTQRARVGHLPTNHLVEDTISQRKDEEEMDGDEQLLTSEEGEKLSNKERRQLRNRLSARAFRSRRKGKSLSNRPDKRS